MSGEDTEKPSQKDFHPAWTNVRGKRCLSDFQPAWTKCKTKWNLHTNPGGSKGACRSLAQLQRRVKLCQIRYIESFSMLASKLNK